MSDRPKVLCSFSGGRSSALMAYLMLLHWSDSHDLRFVFANTGKERKETLDFVDHCDRAWSLGVVWVEAVTNPDLKACTHRVVSYKEASRDGKPFEDVIAKYGIPNMNYLHCTTRVLARERNK